MRFATYIFDAKSHQDPALTVFLHFARPVPSEMKSHKISPPCQMGRNSGMRGGAGGRLDGGLRSADLRLQVESEVVDLCFGFDTPALAIRQGRRIAPRIPPGLLWNRFAHSAWPAVGNVQLSNGPPASARERSQKPYDIY